MEVCRFHVHWQCFSYRRNDCRGGGKLHGTYSTLHSMGILWEKLEWRPMLLDGEKGVGEWRMQSPFWYSWYCIGCYCDGVCVYVEVCILSYLLCIVNHNDARTGRPIYGHLRSWDVKLWKLCIPHNIPQIVTDGIYVICFFFFDHV